jgi:CsoR family transcriptional regulator, copper-sensing transcriptional repressor
MPNQHAHSSEKKRALKIRVRKIAGQLAAIERMIDSDSDCTEVLTQVVSARKGLKSFAEVIIGQHVEHCIQHASSEAEGRRKLRELLVVLQRYVE